MRDLSSDEVSEIMGGFTVSIGSPASWAVRAAGGWFSIAEAFALGYGAGTILNTIAENVFGKSASQYLADVGMSINDFVSRLHLEGGWYDAGTACVPIADFSNGGGLTIPGAPPLPDPGRMEWLSAT